MLASLHMIVVGIWQRNVGSIYQLLLIHHLVLQVDLYLRGLHGQLASEHKVGFPVGADMVSMTIAMTSAQAHDTGRSRKWIERRTSCAWYGNI